MTIDILITNGLLLPYPGSRDMIDSGFIAVNDSRIIAVGQMKDLDITTAGRKIDAGGKLVMPGLVNTHCHAAMTLFRGLADDLELTTWLHKHIFPAEAKHVNPEMVYWCTKLAAAEMILSGTTLVADGYFHEHDAARGFSDAGLRAVAAQGVIDFPAPGVPDPEKNIQTAGNFIDFWQNRDPLITPAVFTHSPYTCCPQTLRNAKKLARSKNTSLFIHLAETQHEQAMIIEPQADSPAKHLEALGILDDQTICVHSVWLNDNDLDCLQKSGAQVVTCPQSNLKLASGIAPLKNMLNKSIPVGLGTDGCASNNTLDLFREMDVCTKLQKIPTLDPVAVPASTILNISTSGGARLLGFEKDLGRLAPGNLADIILIDTNKPHLQPFYNPDLLVYSAAGADVETVIINGKIVMENRTLLTMDINKTMKEVRRLAENIK
jgi:5-methylthioadenosine/S-adenosylhomocysteine deaminase